MIRSQINLFSKTIKFFTLAVLALLFFVSGTLVQAESGWITPRFEYVGGDLPSECSSTQSAIEIVLVDYSGNPVSSNGPWQVFVGGFIAKTLPANTNSSGFFCINANSDSLKVTVAGDGQYKDFESPVIIPSALSSDSLTSLSGTKFRGFVQLTSLGSGSTVQSIGIDYQGLDFFKPTVSKFIIESRDFNTTLNNSISANSVKKTTIALQNKVSGKTPTFVFPSPVSEGVNLFTSEAFPSDSGDGIFYWIALQNLDGKVIENDGAKGWTFSDNPFSSISNINSFAYDLTPPWLANVQSAGAPVVDDTLEAGRYSFSIAAEFGDNLMLKDVSVKVYEKGTDTFVGGCEQSFAEGTSYFSWRYGNACVISNVPAGDYYIVTHAIDYSDNETKKSQDYSISPDIDKPEMGLGNVERTTAPIQESRPAFSKVSWSQYNFYGHILDLNNGVIPKYPGSNDPTPYLGFCFSLENRDFKMGEDGVRCVNNSSYNSVGLSASMPVNFARATDYSLAYSQAYGGSSVDFSTLKINVGGVDKNILSGEGDTTTVYFRSYGTNVAGTGYSPWQSISVSNSAEVDPDITLPVVSFYSEQTDKRADSALLGVIIESYGGVKAIHDWGLCFAKTPAERQAMIDDLETMIANDNNIDLLDQGKYSPNSKFAFVNGKTSDGGLAIDDFGYSYPTCRFSSNGLGNWSTNRFDAWGSGEGQNPNAKRNSAHIFLSTSLTQKDNLQINNPLEEGTTYYAFAFAKNIKGIATTSGEFTTGLRDYNFGFDTNRKKVTADEDTYDVGTKIYGESTLYFYALDESTVATPVTGREVAYKIEITDKSTGAQVGSTLFGTTKAWRSVSNYGSSNLYTDPAFSRITLYDMALGSYNVKITLNDDEYYHHSKSNPTLSFDFNIEQPLSLGDTTTTGGTEVEDLNVDPNLTLYAEPNLVRAGQSTKIKWEMDNVAPYMECVIQGPSTFGASGKETFNHVFDDTKDKTDRILGEVDSGAISNTQIYTFSCSNTIETYTTTARVSVVGSQQEI